ncbi:MAG: alginate O-acetyltransferase AlgX-related protein, partial [Planctomycetota bacterium]
MLLAAFFALLLLPAAGWVTGWGAPPPPPGDQPDRPHRSAFVWPATWAGWRRVPAALNAHCAANFGWRSLLLHLHAWTRVHLLRTSTSRRVVLGHDGRLFLRLEEETSMSRPLLERWARLMQQRADWCAERGIHYLPVLVPLKSRVHQADVPRWLVRRHPRAYEQLRTHLRAHTTTAPLDLTPVLRDAGEAYARRDTHWSARGAYAAVAAIVATLRARGARLRPVRDADWSGSPQLEPRRNLARMLGLRSGWHEAGDVLAPRAGARAAPAPDHTQPHLQPPSALWIGPDADAPRVVWFGDSHTVASAPILAEYCARLAVHRRQPGSDDGLLTVHTPLLRTEAPDIVIDQFSEQGLGLPPANPLALRRTTDGAAFAAATRSVWRWTDDADLHPKPGTRLEPERTIVTTDADGWIVMPPLLVAPGHDAVLRLDMQSEAFSVAEVFYRAPGQAAFDGAHRAAALIHPGRTVCHLRLPAAGRVAWRFDPATIAGRWRIRSAEVREVPARTGAADARRL